jgi:valyl-tRNA synthetase
VDERDFCFNRSGIKDQEERMSFEKRYQPERSEPELDARWQSEGTYHFDPQDDQRPLYSIDSPPATVSGHLHLGHVYSYSHADFMARFFRMRGYTVFYPMGFDDNGLPTERYVEKKLKIRAAQVGRQAFIEHCLEASMEAERDYRALWQRLGLSIDWRYTYRTIDEHSRRCSQRSFLDLVRQGQAYRARAPMIWCPECRTAVAQADLEDRERSSEFVTLPFRSDNGEALHIATTRPELLAACVAIFVHPEDARYQGWVGQQVRVPLYGQAVPVLTDPTADPAKGTGAVMCCTFGDQADVAWWYGHQLALVEAISEDGRMLLVTGEIAGLSIDAARHKIKTLLLDQNLILDRTPTSGTIRVHERCDTPVEFLVTSQWFIRVLENKAKFLELGQQLRWHPAHMQARYQAWVENLNWDWCISRQRYYGVPFPVWYCAACGEMMLAEDNELPVDPLTRGPGRPCACGSTEFRPDTDIMDTWATSSVSPEIASGWLEDEHRFARLFPMSLRPQASEIIRTWTFYSIVKSYYHFGRLPWSDALISGWGLAGEGMGKISKSKGGGPMAPMEMIQRYSADAVRYWAASTAPGKDSVISEEKIQMGAKLVTKLWNVARFAEPFMLSEAQAEGPVAYSVADQWILASLDRLIGRVTDAFEHYEYAQARGEIEGFFWRELTDNYLEMAKLRLYSPDHPEHGGACSALKAVLRTLLKLLAPLLPFVTEQIWMNLFAAEEAGRSIHLSSWPQTCPERETYSLADQGELLISIASAVRRYKSENALSLGSELQRLQIVTTDAEIAGILLDARSDIGSVTRARVVEFAQSLDPGMIRLAGEAGTLELGILP